VLIWRAIQSKAASHPDWSQREVAKALHVSKSLINKVLRRQSAGERGPRKHGTGVRRCFSPITIKYMVELLSHEGKGKSNTMRDVQRILKEELGQSWGMSTLNRHLNQEHSRQKAIFEDPRKWTPNNCRLYKNFLLWRREVPVATHYRVKIFDEARVDRTHLGNLVIWSRRGQRPLRERYRRDIVVESWTITVLTVLDSSYPLIYTVTPNASNGDKFIQFLQACLPFIFPGDMVMGDNCSFHQKGWSSDVAASLLSAVGVQYRLLPKYSPEFSPAEKVFSFLKAHLRLSFNVKDELLPSIISILNKVTMPAMVSWYESCGWLR